MSFAPPFSELLSFPEARSPKALSACLRRLPASQRAQRAEGARRRVLADLRRAIEDALDLISFDGFGFTQDWARSNPAKMREHMESEGDPVTRAFRPLLLEAPLVDKQRRREAVERTPFDRCFGEALTTLMGQALSKPTMLRTVALGACLGLVLKILGAGYDGGRPALLALLNAEERGPKPLRDASVVSFRRGVESLDRRVAALLPTHPLASELMKKAGTKAPSVEVPDTRKLETLAASVIPAARAAKGYDEIYWPDDFAVEIGRKVGCGLPLTGRAGWAPHLTLSSELVEVLILMHVASGQRAVPWSRFWARVRADLGVVIGANRPEDIAFLAHAGVEHVSDESLEDNAEAILAHAVRRGVARRLPDGEAEVGGELS